MVLTIISQEIFKTEGQFAPPGLCVHQFSVLLCFCVLLPLSITSHCLALCFYLFLCMVVTGTLHRELWRHYRLSSQLFNMCLTSSYRLFAPSHSHTPNAIKALNKKHCFTLSSAMRKSKSSVLWHRVISLSNHVTAHSVDYCWVSSMWWQWGPETTDKVLSGSSETLTDTGWLDHTVLG